MKEGNTMKNTGAIAFTSRCWTCSLQKLTFLACRDSTRITRPAMCRGIRRLAFALTQFCTIWSHCPLSPLLSSPARSSPPLASLLLPLIFQYRDISKVLGHAVALFTLFKLQLLNSHTTLACYHEDLR
mmetsp:Transcript_28948/g.74318  ORF Transcript_28948/g.74318 Transcript_28948/m.74318 type:complete len:128 (+) Transcript_28948:867-1250(+)